MMLNIAVEIEKIIGNALSKVAPSITKQTEKKLGGFGNVKDLEATSNKLEVSGNIDIAKVKKELVKEVTSQIASFLKQVKKEYGVSFSETAFNNEIKATIEKIMDFVPLQIQQVVTESVLLSYTQSTSQVAKDLSGKIEQSVRKAEILLNEALTRKVREKNSEIMQKAEEKGDKYLFSHVKDSKNAPFCRDYGNQIKSREEWENIKSDIFIEGGHFGCRGIMVLVKEDEIDKVEAEVSEL